MFCEKEGGQRGFPAQERLPFPSWGFTGRGETKGAGKTLGKFHPAWCWPPWGTREGTAPGGTKGAELGQNSWGEALVEEQQRVVQEGQRLVSLAPGAQPGAKANTCAWFVTPVSTRRPRALSQLQVACDSQAQEGQIQGPARGSPAIKVSLQAPVTSVAQPMLTY